MKETNYRYRTKMLQLFLEKEYSPKVKGEISHLFKNMKEEEKEKLAKMIVSLIQEGRTEQEALNKIKKMVENLTNDYWNPEEFQKKIDKLKAQRQNLQTQQNQ